MTAPQIVDKALIAFHSIRAFLMYMLIVFLINLSTYF